MGAGERAAVAEARQRRALLGTESQCQTLHAYEESMCISIRAVAVPKAVAVAELCTNGFWRKWNQHVSEQPLLECLLFTTTKIFIHKILNPKGELEQPAGAAWYMHVDMRTSSCDASSHTQVLTFKLTNTLGKAPVRVPPGYVLREGFGYFRAATHALMWTEARDACARDGAFLAFADSQEEALMLATKFNFDVPGSPVKHLAWYGASDTAEEGKFVTVTGAALEDTGFASFPPGIPNGHRSENCLVINKQNQLLDDASCPGTLAFICKVPL